MDAVCDEGDGPVDGGGSRLSEVVPLGDPS